jgi:hypothetical protein
VKNSVSESIARVLAPVACAAFVATCAMVGGCVMDASPEPTPSTGSKTSEVDRTVHAPAGLATGTQSPVGNDQIAPKINGALGPTDNSTISVPGNPVLPLLAPPPNTGGIDDPGGTVEDGPRPHPWEPAPDDPNGGAKPKIGGSEQSSSSTPTTGK